MSTCFTDDQYSVQHLKESGGDSHLQRVKRSSSGHTVLGGELTIDILPDNMTRIVVSAAPQCFF